MAERVENSRSPRLAQREPPHHTRPPTMGRATRVVVGALAFVPLVIIVAAAVRGAATPSDPSPAAGVPATTDVGGMLIGTVLVMALLVLFFGAFVFNDRHMPTQTKALWLVGFLVGAPVVIPLYWYMNVLHAPRHRQDA
jgi:hypothetical protein